MNENIFLVFINFLWCVFKKCANVFDSDMNDFDTLSCSDIFHSPSCDQHSKLQRFDSFVQKCISLCCYWVSFVLSPSAICLSAGWENDGKLQSNETTIKCEKKKSQCILLCLLAFLFIAKCGKSDVFLSFWVLFAHSLNWHESFREKKREL